MADYMRIEQRPVSANEYRMTVRRLESELEVLRERVKALEAKRGPGRPRKVIEHAEGAESPVTL